MLSWMMHSTCSVKRAQATSAIVGMVTISAAGHRASIDAQTVSPRTASHGVSVPQSTNGVLIILF